MKIKLKHAKPNVHDKAIQWEKCRPFVLNPRGLLVHRVRGVLTFYDGKVATHHAVHYWCGNQTCLDIGNEDKVFLRAPPEGRLVCSFCEAAVERAQEKSADELVGKHVHKGVLRVQRVCCRGCDQN